ncbi:hypothetical protein BOX15_Mlig009524g4 [Macrostomum lignano]|uniref:Uncharacterized protein n=1 Tax=Macrostomum lignano TaxID=282301 RepID=A0A267FRJ4_9PLAT|nr:hypothetical protein BOX15_Mlig009524g4 [Macrostomum lignano]
MISAALRSAQVLAAGMTRSLCLEASSSVAAAGAASDDTAADGGASSAGRYFLLLAEREEQRIRADTDWIEACLDDESLGLSEEVSGILRVSAGKARLLLTEKLAQFRGLCEDNMANGVTQYCDLNGFWAICCLQLQDIGRMLATCRQIRDCQFRRVPPAPPSPPAPQQPREPLQKRKPSRAPARQQQRQQQPAKQPALAERQRRERLAELKRRGRQRLQHAEDSAAPSHAAEAKGAEGVQIFA